ncbi:MAG: WYL domain-containing protein [Thaumarchaeota archaeon]|jgi:predicted DNA-binding transcriptional regulator YafY|nr:WYL domain-containing protein [Candidatus Geocrenenecus arthurdayi]
MVEDVVSLEITYEDSKFIYLVLKALMEKVIDVSFQYEVDEFGVELIDREKLPILLSKVEQTLREDDKKKIDREVYLRRFHPYVDMVDEEVYKVLMSAYVSQRRVRITYYSYSRGEFTEREVDIYKISHKYIIAYDYSSREVRRFRVSRIVKAEKLAEIYTIPEEYRKRTR